MNIFWTDGCVEEKKRKGNSIESLISYPAGPTDKMKLNNSLWISFTTIFSSITKIDYDELNLF